MKMETTLLLGKTLLFVGGVLLGLAIACFWVATKERKAPQPIAQPASESRFVTIEEDIQDIRMDIVDLKKDIRIIVSIFDTIYDNKKAPPKGHSPSDEKHKKK